MKGDTALAEGFLYISHLKIFSRYAPAPFKKEHKMFTLKSPNMKKLLAVCFIAAMALGLSSCDKEDENNSNSNSNAVTPTTLAGTLWEWAGADESGLIEFTTATEYTVTVRSNDQAKGTFTYAGTYTYSNGSGSLDVVVEGQEYHIDFTVNGNTLTATNTPTGNITMTRVQDTPQPTPTPTPTPSYPLSGTAWQGVYTDPDDGIIETMTITFGTTTCQLAAVFSDDDEVYETTGTYTFEGTLENGHGSVTTDGGVATFVVHGQNADITSEGRTVPFTRIR